MTSQQFLVCDSSTLANFKAWAQAISNFFATAGWVQTSDTGQVNWGSIGAVPGTGAYVYEVWKPGDALTTFYVKIEYGNFSGSANCPSLRLSLGTGTNGAGTLTGFFFGPVTTQSTSFTAPSTTTQFECNFSGANNRMSVMLWRNGTGNCQQFLSIERSLDSTGTYTGDYATLWTGGFMNLQFTTFSQRSLYFTVGAGPNSPNGGNSGQGGLVLRGIENSGSGNTTSFRNSLSFDTCAPHVGYYDYQCTTVGGAWGADFSEGVPFTVTLYGATRTYMPSKTGPFAQAGPRNLAGSLLCMRYD